MSQPDDIEIAPAERDTYMTETSFVDDSFVTMDEDPIIEDFTAVSEGVKYLTEYTVEYKREESRSKAHSKSAEEVYGVKENTIKRIISARWRLNDYLGSEEREVQERFNHLQQFTKDIVSFLKILFLLKSSEPFGDIAGREDEVKSKHSMLVGNPTADNQSHQPPDSDAPLDSSPLLRDYETHEADDIAILQGIRAEVESYSQQWVTLGEYPEERKQIFSDTDPEEFPQHRSISFRSISTRRNILWVLLGIIGAAVIIFGFIIILLIIIATAT